jgi:hypothetical protein
MAFNTVLIARPCLFVRLVLGESGSKFWQSNWEHHVDLLADMILGPLFKVISVSEESIQGNPLYAAGQFSVSKVNQILSVFVTAVWLAS